MKCQDEYNDLKEEYDYVAEDSKQKILKIESLEKQAAMTTTTIVPAKSSTKSKVNKKDQPRACEPCNPDCQDCALSYLEIH